MTEVIWYLQTFFLLSVFLSTVILGEIMAVVIVAMIRMKKALRDQGDFLPAKIYHVNNNIDLGVSIEVDG